MAHKITPNQVQAKHRKELAEWLASPEGIAASSQFLTSDLSQYEFISLEDIGLEESPCEPVFGGFYSDSANEHISGGIYELLDWFYDGDSQSVEYCN